MAEGGGLLNRYTVQSRIKGSNPFLSAILLRIDLLRIDLLRIDLLRIDLLRIDGPRSLHR